MDTRRVFVTYTAIQLLCGFGLGVAFAVWFGGVA